MFTQETLFTARSVYNATSYRIASAIHTYRTTDTIAQVMVPGYFPDNFGVNELQVAVDDLLILMTSDYNVIAKVTSISPSGLVLFLDFPTNLVTDQSANLSNVLTSVVTTPVPYNFTAYKAGKVCILTFPQVSGPSGGGTVLDMQDALPEAFRPPQFTSVPAGVINNSLYEVGGMLINSDGTFGVVRQNGIAFDPTGDAGFGPGLAVYQTI